jgi:hypothetical protein
MNDLIQLTDAEIAGVSGGILNQDISISATQSNSASVSQNSTATNSGSVSAAISANGGTASTGSSADGEPVARPQPRQALSQAIIRWWFRRTTSQRATTSLSISTSDSRMLWPISFWADRR